MSRINNQQELNDVITGLENRVNRLEEENQNLWKWVHYFEKRVKSELPANDLFHKHFLRRAFAVWGHYFVANTIINLIVWTVFFLLYGAIILSFLNRMGMVSTTAQPSLIQPTSTPWIIMP